MFKQTRFETITHEKRFFFINEKYNISRLSSKQIKVNIHIFTHIHISYLSLSTQYADIWCRYAIYENIYTTQSKTVYKYIYSNSFTKNVAKNFVFRNPLYARVLPIINDDGDDVKGGFAVYMIMSSSFCAQI